jgi:hypothetical protein
MQSMSWGPDEICRIAVDILFLITAPAIQYALERNKSWYCAADVPAGLLCLDLKCWRISVSWHLRNKPLVCHGESNSYLIHPITKKCVILARLGALLYYIQSQVWPLQSYHMVTVWRVKSSLSFTNCVRKLLSRKSSVSKVHGYGLKYRDSIPGNGSDLSLDSPRCSGRFWVPTSRVPMRTRGMWDRSTTIFVMSKFRMCGTLSYPTQILKKRRQIYVTFSAKHKFD